MRPEPVPRITPEEMPQVWPDLWRAEDQDPATLELETPETKLLPCDYGIAATASAVEAPDNETTIRHTRPFRNKARHALRHFELGPFKIHRVALPVAAIVTGVAVAYFTPHGNTPAIAENPRASSSPHPSRAQTPKKEQVHPTKSPTSIPFAISGYESSPSPSTSQSWRYDGGTGDLSPQPNTSKSQNNEPKPRDSPTPTQPRPTESIPPAHETPPQTAQSESSPLQATETPASDADVSQSDSTGSGPSSS